MFTGYAQLLLQVFISLTGNYTFFNLLTAVLCVPLVLQPQKHHRTIQEMLLMLSGILITAWMCRSYCVVILDTASPSFPVDLRKLPAFMDDVKNGVMLACGCVLLGTLYGFSLNLSEWFRSQQRRSWARKIFQGSRLCVWNLFLCCLLCHAFFPVLTLHKALFQSIHGVVLNSMGLDIVALYSKANACQISNGYGLFRSMTGMRLESHSTCFTCCLYRCRR